MNELDKNELGIIDEITRKFSGTDQFLIFGVGDDCAVIRPKRDRDQIITTDSMVAGVHFPPSLTWEQVGWRNAATALSDIAAMGGVPRFCFSSLHLSKEFTKEDAIGYFTGLSSLLKKYETTLAGGNIVRYDGPPQFTLTIIGEIKKGKTLLRHKAKVGDAIFVAGTPGDAAAGLEILLRDKIPYIKEDDRYALHENELVKSFIFPEPQIDIGKLLVKEELSQCAIDTSDGFLSDLGKICEKSRVGAQLSESRIRLSRDLRIYCKKRDFSPHEKAYFGGDDYALVFTVPKSRKRDVPNHLDGIPLTEIGKIVSGNTISFVKDTRPPLSLPVKGYEH